MTVLLLVARSVPVSAHVYVCAFVALVATLTVTEKKILAPGVMVAVTATVLLRVSVPVVAVGTVLDAAAVDSVFVVTLLF